MEVEEFEQKLSDKQQKCSELLHDYYNTNTSKNECVSCLIELCYDMLKNGCSEENLRMLYCVKGNIHHLQHKLKRVRKRYNKSRRHCKRFRSSFWSKYEDYSSGKNEKKHGKAWCTHMTEKMLEKINLVKGRDLFLTAEKSLLLKMAEIQCKDLKKKQRESLLTIEEEMPEYGQEVQYLLENVVV